MLYTPIQVGLYHRLKIGLLNLLSPHGFFQAQNAPKPVFGRGSAPDPAGGAYDAPPDPLVGWGGGQPFPIPPRRLRRLDLAAIPLLLKEIYANGYISVCKSTAVVWRQVTQEVALIFGHFVFETISPRGAPGKVLNVETVISDATS